ncbi:MAG: selenocysteine-specific translation elongation factor [Gemmataceae bacterium]|nr:selenocysteine-specific translation elongation factor [Gemmataceae bacterium]
MPRDLILGTSGHIDHGKTALVKALTGTDCDRLPEEKRRGITIDIGFATLDLGEFRLGIVDVPGHERFIKNMLAGATGIDLAILVVAADDSVMPQTREHLEVLRLLGLRHGLIALTKCDLVDEETREVVELEIRELVQGSFLENAPIIRTSAHTGEGIPELKASIAEACRHVAPPGGHGWFRMAIDRSFILQGHGTVVTGSATSGSIKVGDEVDWLPRGEKVRVRSLQNHGQPVDEVHRGMRAAINLAGVHHENVIRGQELATPGYLLPSRLFTVRLHCLADAPRPLKHRAPVRFHIGTAEVLATIAVLDGDRIEPGGWGLAQAYLQEPAMVVWGQPFVVRESSATQTLGGGQVLQPTARKIRRRHLEILERVEKLWSDDVEQRALAAAWFAGTAGLSAADLVRCAGTLPEQAPILLRRLLDRGELVEVESTQVAADALLHIDVVRDLEDRILASLAHMHEQTPVAGTHERQKILVQLAYLGDDRLIEFTITRLLRQKRLIGDAKRVARSDFKPKLSNSLSALKQRVLGAYREAQLKPVRPDSFAGHAGGNAALLDDLMRLCVDEGHLIHVGEDYYVNSEAEAEFRQRLLARLSAVPGLTVAEIRDLLGTGRRHAMIMCEYLDKIGITRREGDLRVRAR